MKHFNLQSQSIHLRNYETTDTPSQQWARLKWAVRVARRCGDEARLAELKAECWAFIERHFPDEQPE